jgi:hypothetical protein
MHSNCMFTQELIFSTKKSDRIKRHLLFWFCWWVYFGATHAANPFGKPEIAYFRNPVFTLTESVFLMLAQLPLAYSMLYIILPKFILKKKYTLSIIASLILWNLGGLFNFYLISELFPKTLSFLLPDQYLANTQRPPSVSFFMAVLANYKGAFTITGIALFIKFAKYWYLKEQRNMQLLKENTDAQLQLLTAQIHPHFLFNTLNNIYSKTQLESPNGANMILELSHIMRYVLDEGKKTSVSLENELQLLRDYINLEKIRYDDRLDLHVSFPRHTENVCIAPLLLLPFVENCFKHGSSHMIKNPWINLKIELDGETLYMKLMNGKPTVQFSLNNRQGTGIDNVKKRLGLLYPDKHSLQIENDKEVFIVNLSIELTRVETGKLPQSFANKSAVKPHA